MPQSPMFRQAANLLVTIAQLWQSVEALIVIPAVRQKM
jgi:hypothetical protein